MLTKCLPTIALAAALFLSGAAHADNDASLSAEFRSESKALIAATTALFDRVEARKRPRTAIPVIGLPPSATKISAEAGADADISALTRNGPVTHLTGYQITWYPMERLLGSVDFMGTWNGNRNLVCGYLTWDLSDPDAPVLENVTANFVDLGVLGHASANDIHRHLMDANCAFGAIDPNFRVLSSDG